MTVLKATELSSGIRPKGDSLKTWKLVKDLDRYPGSPSENNWPDSIIVVGTEEQAQYTARQLSFCEPGCDGYWYVDGAADNKQVLEWHRKAAEEITLDEAEQFMRLGNGAEYWIDNVAQVIANSDPSASMEKDKEA